MTSLNLDLELSSSGSFGGRIVVLHSGGHDSSVLALHMAEMLPQSEVCLLGLNYGQRHVRELEYAEDFAAFYNFNRIQLDLPELSAILAGSSQTDPTVEVPEGHYAEESMRATVVPNRNMLLISMAAAYAISLKASIVAYAAHSGDHAIYPDCRPEFVDAMVAALRLCDWDPPELVAPFVYMSKADIAARGAELGINPAMTWSCYKGRTRHCGKCGTCIERREAFQLAGVEDTTAYEGE